jgi:hypothetical protein
MFIKMILFIIVCFLIILTIGYLKETKIEQFKFKTNIKQTIIQNKCEALYPFHLSGLSKDEIENHPDFQTYKLCLQKASL